MTSIVILSIVFIIFQVASVRGDYDCLCSYNVEMPIYSKDSTLGQVIGYMYEFDCKAVYAKGTKDSKFQPIQFENQVGYIENGNGVQIQICQGSVPFDDLVKGTTTPVISSPPPPTTATTTTTTTATTSTTTGTTTKNAVETISTTPSVEGTTANTPTVSVYNTTSTKQSTQSIVIVVNGNIIVNSSNQQQTMNTTQVNISAPPQSNYLSTVSSNFTSLLQTSVPTLPVSTSSNSSFSTTITVPTSTTHSSKVQPLTTYSTSAPISSTSTTTNPPSSPRSTPTLSPTTTFTTTTKRTTTSAPKPSCPSGWIMHQTSCYMFHTNNRRHWSDANNDCISAKSHLAIIETADEFNFLKQQLDSRIDTDDDDDSDSSAWVAGRDNNNEGTWEWYDGTTNTYKPFTYTHWGHDEPDAGEGEHEEDCMTMVGNKGFQWADYSCNENMFFVCERSALPRTTVQTQSPPKQTNAATCQPGWIRNHGSCYLFHTNSQSTWQDANRDCVSKTSHLAIIETVDEFSFLKQQLENHNGDSTAWIAGRDNNNEGSWEWFDGTTSIYKPFTYTNWGHDEPDAGDGEHEEDCVAMVEHKDFKWADYSCNENKLYVCEQSVLPLSQTQTQSPQKQTNTASCQPDWIMYHGSCYLFHTDSRYKWRDANSFCSSHQAHLAIIETAEENHFLKQQSSLRIHEDGDSDSGVWIAGSDDDHEGRWEWIDGLRHTKKTIGYSNWHPGEPDSGDGKHGEDCMCMIGEKGFEWQDYRCSTHMFFICEKRSNFAAPLVG